MQIFNRQINFNFFSFIFILMPLALLTGPAIPDIILSLIALYFLIKTIQLKLFYFYEPYIIKILIVFSAYLIFSSLISSNPMYSLFEYGVIFYFRYFFYILGIVYLFENNKNLINIFGKLSLLLTIFVIFDTYFQFVFGKNIFGFESGYSGRLSSFFKDELVIGIFLSSFCPIVIGLVLKMYKLNLNNRYIILFILISFVSIILSGERAATLHYIIFIFIIITLSKTISFLRLLIIFVSIISIFISSIFLSENLNNRYKETLSDFKETEFSLPFTVVHEGHLKSGFKMFVEKPIFGQGPKMFKKLCNKKNFYNEYSCSSHPHNFYLQLLAETGLVGVLFLISLFIYILKYLIKNLIFKINKQIEKIDSDFKIVLMASLFSMIWPLAPTFDFFNNWYSAILFTNLALILFFFNKISFKK
tara:strand:- start:26096 stop:27349 length:1254 start_codon:yes stop_codon:yes gene_type:complete